MRIDGKTGVKYTDKNIPLGRIQSIITIAGKQLVIFSENGTLDCWYNDLFLGDRYAVFIKLNGFYQQITKWYYYYGSCVKRMCKLAKEYDLKDEI